MLPTANQRHIDQFYNKVSVIKQTANCRGRRGADSTDCLIFGQDVQHQIVIHSPEIKTDSLAVCLSGIFSVTDRWVITVSQSWQAVETKKWRCGTRGWTRGEDGGGDACLLLAIDESTRKWSENEFCTLSSYFRILIQNVSCQKSHFPQCLYLEPPIYLTP